MEAWAVVVIVLVIVVYYVLRLLSLAQVIKRDRKRGKKDDS